MDQEILDKLVAVIASLQEIVDMQVVEETPEEEMSLDTDVEKSTPSFNSRMLSELLNQI